MKETQDGEQHPANQFLHMLPRVRRGELSDRCDEKLRELLQAIDKEGRQGELTLKLKISPDGEPGELYAVAITGEVSIKPPVQKIRAGMMYVGENLELTSVDPRQKEMEGIVLEAESSGPAREVSEARAISE